VDTHDLSLKPPEQSHRVQFGSLSLSRRPSTGLTDNDNGYIAPFLSTNPALRLCESEGLAAVGLENSLAEPVRADLVETVEKPDRVGYGSPPGLRMIHDQKAHTHSAAPVLLATGRVNGIAARKSGKLNENGT